MTTVKSHMHHIALELVLIVKKKKKMIFHIPKITTIHTTLTDKKRQFVNTIPKNSFSTLRGKS